jgi:hypothetical protein
VRAEVAAAADAGVIATGYSSAVIRLRSSTARLVDRRYKVVR